MMPFKDWEEMVDLGFLCSLLNCTVIYGILVCSLWSRCLSDRRSCPADLRTLIT